MTATKTDSKYFISGMSLKPSIRILWLTSPLWSWTTSTGSFQQYRSSGSTPSSSWITELHGAVKSLSLLWFFGQSPAPWSPHLWTRPQDTRWLRHMGKGFIPYQEWTVHWFPAENHGLGFRGADPHPSCFTLSCEPIQWVQKVTNWWCHQDHIICKKQECDPQPTELQPTYNYTWRFWPLNSQTGLSTRCSPGRGQPLPGMSLTYCRKPKYSSCFGRTEIGWPLVGTPTSHTPTAPPTIFPKKCGH